MEELAEQDHVSDSFYEPSAYEQDKQDHMGSVHLMGFCGIGIRLLVVPACKELSTTWKVVLLMGWQICRRWVWKGIPSLIWHPEMYEADHLKERIVHTSRASRHVNTKNS